MADANHTTIRDRMIYLVICRGDGGGAYLPERQVSDLDRATTVKDIATRQIEDMIQVLECNPVEGTCRDVTEDIAQDVMAHWADDGEPLRDWQRNFVEQHVGILAANAFPRAA